MRTKLTLQVPVPATEQYAEVGAVLDNEAEKEESNRVQTETGALPK